MNWSGPITTEFGKCRNGHAFTAENTYFRPEGKRTCVTCHRARVAAYRARYDVRRRPSAEGAVRVLDASNDVGKAIPIGFVDGASVVRGLPALDTGERCYRSSVNEALGGGSSSALPRFTGACE